MTETEREIINFYNKGYKTTEIALIVPLSRKQINLIIKNNKAEINRQKAITGNRAIVINAVESGVNDINELQKLTGLSKATIYTYSNIGRKKPHYNHGHTREIIADLQEGQMSQSEIARKYGVSRQAVSKAKKYL